MNEIGESNERYKKNDELKAYVPTCVCVLCVRTQFHMLSQSHHHTPHPIYINSV